MPVDDPIKSARAAQARKRPRLYYTWTNMWTRIRNPNVKEYKNYGARGIKVCDEWREFARFREWAHANGYRDELTIERRDVDGDYCPENCTWVTKAAQNLNRRNNRVIEAFGESKPLAEWSRDPRCLFKKASLAKRLAYLDPEVAFSGPPGTDPSIKRRLVAFPGARKTATAFGEIRLISEWATDPRCLIASRLLGQRIRCGWDAEKAMTTPAAKPGHAFRTRLGGKW